MLWSLSESIFPWESRSLILCRSYPGRIGAKSPSKKLDWQQEDKTLCLPFVSQTATQLWRTQFCISQSIQEKMEVQGFSNPTQVSGPYSSSIQLLILAQEICEGYTYRFLCCSSNFMWGQSVMCLCEKRGFLKLSGFQDICWVNLI